MAQACSNPRVARATTRDREISNGQLRLAYEFRYFMAEAGHDAPRNGVRERVGYPGKAVGLMSRC